MAYGSLKYLLARHHMGLGIHNATPPTVLIQSEPNFMINKAVIGEYKTDKCFGDLSIIKKIVAL